MKTVLIAEDDTITAQVLFKILTKRGGFAVNYPDNVEELMQIAQSGEVDIILMDLNFSNSVYPCKSGIDIAIDIIQLLKADEKTANIPIMLMATQWMCSDQKKGLSAADDCISKRIIVDHQAFIARVRALLPED